MVIIVYQNLKIVLNEITFTELDIFIKLQQVKEDKVCSPDGIHLKILKDCAETLAKSLFLIFTESLSSGIVPLDLLETSKYFSNL